MTLRHAPDSVRQLELFRAMFTDIATRDAQDAMELPFLSLSKKPRFKAIRYKSADIELIVTGGEPYGIANIWDWDLMMWLMSQVRQAIDSGMPASRKIRFQRHAFLKDSRRGIGGSQYRRFEESIARLKNTNVVTTIRAQSKRTVMFSWIEFADLEKDAHGEVSQAVVVLPEWVFDAVSNERLVLSLHPDYFLLTGGLERWLYRFIRKGAGRSRGGWRWTLATLHERSGSVQSYKYFARDIRPIIQRGRLLDYELCLVEEKGETFVEAKRVSLEATPDPTPPVRVSHLRLLTDTYEHAKAVAPGLDVYALEDDWRRATAKNGIVLENADAAFLAWCKKVSRMARR